MNKTEKINYWIDLADEDIITAEIVLKSKRYLHFGFLAHLAAEKYIKAYYCFKNDDDPPLNHN